MHIISRIVVAATVLIAFPALAEPASEAATTAVPKVDVASADSGPAEKKADPMICERVQEIGSLLRSKKVCMLKSQWDEQRRSDRSNIERSQVQRGLQPAS
ncbi:hypothetical protein SAMN05518801_10896 [Novosphingobium sp. CF614]|uniref:hypothetical protein n=1 Tax=Novosphingobium sp. CF614 TaxID=1884364 RepID=UPI0008EA6070|nr:hypothetical protein [Novosphingobium sp. CF614]SFG14732.1 hypothetical protein SAMN05518801_10896 [Novosphingobium sp. CF614]